MTAITPDVFFPRRSLGDLVLRYEGVAYHVHKQTLYHQSGLFAGYIDSGESDITLPEVITTRSGPVTSDQFCYALKCMYFPRWASAMPFLTPTRDVLDDLSDESKLVQWQLPFAHLDEKVKRLKPSPSVGFSSVNHVLHLLDYLRSVYLLDRCQDVLIFWGYSAITNREAHGLVAAQQCGMKRWEDYLLRNASNIASGMVNAELEGRVWRSLFFSATGVTWHAKEEPKKRPRVVEDSDSSDTEAE